MPAGANKLWTPLRATARESAELADYLSSGTSLAGDAGAALSAAGAFAGRCGRIDSLLLRGGSRTFEGFIHARGCATLRRNKCHSNGKANEQGSARIAVVRVRNRPAPRADIRPDGLPPMPETTAFGTLHQDNANQCSRDNGKYDEEEVK
jgi:hypothetical protein